MLLPVNWHFSHGTFYSAVPLSLRERSQWPEFSGPDFSVTWPKVIAGQVDVLPSQWREVPGIAGSKAGPQNPFAEQTHDAGQ
jgi:hypothetical protein